VQLPGRVGKHGQTIKLGSPRIFGDAKGSILFPEGLSFFFYGVGNITFVHRFFFKVSRFTANALQHTPSQSTRLRIRTTAPADRHGARAIPSFPTPRLCPGDYPGQGAQRRRPFDLRNAQTRSTHLNRPEIPRRIGSRTKGRQVEIRRRSGRPV
jgi:hypothetical protein